MAFNDALALLNLRLNNVARGQRYLSLAKQLRQLISEQRLALDSRLPATRKLAEQLGVSRTSVLNAYEVLVAEGLVRAQPGSGYYVAAVPAAASSAQRQSTASHVHTSPAKHANPAFASSGDLEQFPFALWRRCLNRVWAKPDLTMLREVPAGGYLPLKQAICDYSLRLRGVQCRPEQVFVTAGSRDTLALIYAALLERGDPIALEDPCYPPLRQGLLAHGANLHPCAVDGEGMQLAPEPCRLAWMTPAKQYPTSTLMSRERRMAWLSYARERGTYLVEDDFDAEFIYRRSTPETLWQLSQQMTGSSVLLAGSFSKVLFPSLRVGYLLVPEPLVERFTAAQSRLGNLCSVPMQPVVAEFIAEPQFHSYLRRMRRLYQRRRDHLYQLIESQLAEYFQPVLPEGGMVMPVYASKHLRLSDSALQAQLKEWGIHASALSKQFYGEGRQGLLLGYSAASEVQLGEAVATLAELCRSAD
ncbi:PLP-dependent aminotransferase family protein [Aliagarivorans marinus]|uniref:MocR-like pyridoxine biosynthesis transcription factor PdxR n=1 Tax=Aliagarivorans marinus TaxID=561965 RepID=UPI000423EF5E|nr:PLP-dependent aminotransferase family protein [Aliagarivorans marinus]